MKRKVVKQGSSTLMISLPSKWIKKYGVQKGDEIDINLLGSNLMIGILKSPELKKTNVEIKASALGVRYITALYRIGYDEIKLIYKDENFIKKIQKTVREQLFGFEIIEESKNYCIIKDLSGQINIRVLSDSIKQTWNLVINMANDCVNEIQNENFLSLENMKFRDTSINKFTNYCTRILLKDVSFGDANSAVRYNFLRNLEDFADEYQDIGRYVGEKKLIVNNNYIEYLKKCNLLLEYLNQNYYVFNQKKLSDQILMKMK